ncbi:MAG TPA: hypothetical protein DIU15_04920, partial [Deltaproteobacteria bacterium]|nr:hypothetical protein [Deltaproteobacteria bacterium]
MRPSPIRDRTTEPSIAIHSDPKPFGEPKAMMRAFPLFLGLSAFLGLQMVGCGPDGNDDSTG